MTDPIPSQGSKNYAAMFHQMATQGGGPAHPIQMEIGKSDNGEPTVWFSMGLSKREEFAAMMMQTIIGRELIHQDKSIVADEAIAYADALLERLKK